MSVLINILRLLRKEKGGDKVFREGELVIRAHVIERPLPNRWLDLVTSSKLVHLTPNWPVIPESLDEINEKSLHPLSLFLMDSSGIIAFNIYSDSVLIEPKVDQKPLKAAEKIAKLLFLWEKDASIRAAWWIIFTFEPQKAL